MKALSLLRSHRRLSTFVVALLLLCGTAASLHHHDLAAPRAARMLSTPSSEEHPSRSLDCLICRAAVGAALTPAHDVVPDQLVALNAVSALPLASTPAIARASSPRAPPSLFA